MADALISWKEVPLLFSSNYVFHLKKKKKDHKRLDAVCALHPVLFPDLIKTMSWSSLSESTDTRSQWKKELTDWLVFIIKAYFLLFGFLHNELLIKVFVQHTHCSTSHICVVELLLSPCCWVYSIPTEGTDLNKQTNKQTDFSVQPFSKK